MCAPHPSIACRERAPTRVQASLPSREIHYMPIRTFRQRALTRAAATIVVLSTAACAGHRTSTAPASMSADAAVAASSRSFEDAVSHGDTVALNALLSDDLVVWRGPDSLNGRAARQAVVAAWGPGRSKAELLLTRGERTTCPGAAFETGRFTAYERTSADSSQATASGTYGVRWRLASGDVPRVTVVSLDTASLSRTSQRVFCATAARLHAEHKRFVLLAALPLTGGSWTTHDGLKSEETARGWPGDKIGFCTHYQGSSTGYPAGYDCAQSTGTDGPPIEMAGARLRIIGPFWVEGLGSPMQQTGTSMGYNASTSSFIVQSYKSRETMALLSCEWRGLRLGVGQSRVNVDWNEFSDVLTYTQGDWRRLGPYSVVTSSASGTGFATELAYSANVLPPVAFEFVVRRRSGIEVATPAIAAYPQSTASFNGTTISAGLSVGY